MILNSILLAVTIVWTPPTTNVDGSPLTDLAGHRAYWGTESGLYSEMIDVGMATNTTITNLYGQQIFYFAVTAYDLAGNESDFSEEIHWWLSTRIHFISINGHSMGER